MRPTILSPKDIERFWSKVNKDGPVPEHCPELGPCWLWLAYCDVDGYGRFDIGDQKIGSHRVSFLLEYGRWPEPCGLHECDNPPCCNPAHVFEGTHQENMDDMVRKGRLPGRRGEAAPGAKLGAAEVGEIRKRYAAGGVNQEALGKEFGIGQAMVSYIVRFKRWNVGEEG